MPRAAPAAFPLTTAEETRVLLFNRVSWGAVLAGVMVGANLLALADCTRQWTAVKAVQMTELELKPFVKDARTAIANLEVRGYHLTCTTAEVIELPHAHRQTA
jgi:hypothetical protein